MLITFGVPKPTTNTIGMTGGNVTSEKIRKIRKSPLRQLPKKRMGIAPTLCSLNQSIPAISVIYHAISNQETAWRFGGWNHCLICGTRFCSANRRDLRTPNRSSCSSIIARIGAATGASTHRRAAAGQTQGDFGHATTHFARARNDG